MEVIYRRSPFSITGTNPLRILMPQTWLDVIGYTRNYIVLTDEAVVLKRGIINKRNISINYDKINSIKIEQGFLGSILNFGDVIILSGNDALGEVVKGIINPEKLKADIQQRVNALGKHKSISQSIEAKDDNLDKLEKLAQLKKKGIITEKEFAVKKKQLLGM